MSTVENNNDINTDLKNKPFKKHEYEHTRKVQVDEETLNRKTAIANDVIGQNLETKKQRENIEFEEHDEAISRDQKSLSITDLPIPIDTNKNIPIFSLDYPILPTEYPLPPKINGGLGTKEEHDTNENAQHVQDQFNYTKENQNPLNIAQQIIRMQQDTEKLSQTKGEKGYRSGERVKAIIGRNSYQYSEYNAGNNIMSIPYELHPDRTNFTDIMFLPLSGVEIK